MKLHAIKREAESKCEPKQLRREGKIPAILYSAGHSSELIAVDRTEFETILRKMKPGRLSTTKFKLLVGDKEFQAIVKDIQYQLTTYDVSHLDFEQLVENIPVNVNVPISCLGASECNGIKLGGFLRQVIRFVKVRCLPKHMPDEFFINVRDLGIRQSKRLSDIEMPKEVKPLARLGEVVVVIAKR